MNAHNCCNCHFKSDAVKKLSVLELSFLEKNSSTKLFEKGEAIINEGDLSTKIAFIKNGLAKIHMHGPVREKILRILPAPAYLCLSISSDDKFIKYSATALERTSVCFIENSVFKELIYKNGNFAYSLLIEQCENEIYNFKKYVNLAQKQVIGLIAESLLCLCDKIYKNNKFNIPLTREEMGDLVGTSRESVSRVLNNFAMEKIINIKKNNVEILNKPLLIQISDKG